jgi:hypothetical protein
MTLTETLQLDEKFLKLEDLRALEYCEKRWQQEGRPVSRWKLVNFIERMLQALHHNGIGYPKILLRRKKEIQRLEFIPQLPTQRSEQGPPLMLAGDACPNCQGRGFLDLPGGNGTLCQPCLGRGRKIA